MKNHGVRRAILSHKKLTVSKSHATGLNLWPARQKLVALLGRFGRGIVQFVVKPPRHMPSIPMIAAAATGSDNRTIHEEWHCRQAATSTHQRTVPVVPLALNSLDCAAQQR